MRTKKILAAALALCMALAMTACSESGPAVYVQSVSSLMNTGGIAPGDRFAGVVVSENVTEIRKDENKIVGALLVKEGDNVEEGQELFTYDTDQLQLSLDKQNLELEQLKTSIESYTQQIAELEKDREKAKEADKLEYTIQIQTLQVDLKEAQLNLTAKEKEVERSEALLQNASVLSPVSGRIQAISENGMDNYGNALPYITIQQIGSFRIKGQLGELQRGGLTEGSRVRIVSRTDENVYWLGTVTLVDYESPSQGSQQNMDYGMVAEDDDMASSSKYPFYVEPDSVEGLMLGQHVYMTVDTGEEAPAGVSIPESFIDYEEDGSVFVWAEKDGKLEKRPVTLGDYNMMQGSYIVLDGLTEADYVAFPDAELCVEGASTTHTAPVEEPAADEGEVG